MNKNEQLKVPNDWKINKFSSLTTSIRSGLSRRLSLVDIGLPIINSGNLQEEGLDMSNLKYWYLNDPHGANTKDYYLKENDILLNFINSLSQIGKSAIYSDIGRPVIYTTNIFRIRVKEEIIPKYLFAFMQSEGFKKCLEIITKPAVNQASFTKEDLSKIFIPTPPLVEQKKIVEILSGIDSLILKTKKIYLKKKILYGNLLNEIIKNDSTKKICSANELIESGHILKIKDGNHGSQYPRSHEFLNVGIPFINASSINEEGEIDFNTCPCLSEKRVKEMRIPPATGGDVILTHNATVGRVSIIPIEIKKVVTSTSTTSYHLNNNLLDSIYLATFFKSPFYQEQLLQIMGQTTRNQVPITAQKELQILLPSMEIQKKISSISSSFSKDIKLHFAKLNKLKLLKQSISNDLLSGAKRLIT